MSPVEVGQIWDDVFGKWVFKVVAVTEYNALLRRLEYGKETFIEHLVPLQRFVPGGGWRLMSGWDE